MATIVCERYLGYSLRVDSLIDTMPMHQGEELERQ